MSAKSDLRAEVFPRRGRLTPEDRAAAGRSFSAALTDLLSEATRVAAYVSVGSEPSTVLLLETRPDTLLPVLRPDGDLDWATGPAHAAARGLREPTGPLLGPSAVATCDLVVVPALAVARTGHRLGRGGGSYDRALVRATGLVVALLYDGELVDSLPAEPHDVPVAAVVTPSYGLVRL